MLSYLLIAADPDDEGLLQGIAQEAGEPRPVDVAVPPAHFGTTIVLGPMAGQTYPGP